MGVSVGNQVQQEEFLHWFDVVQNTNFLLFEPLIEGN
jgi:hypothetical protein